uniref:Uncharacterized protein n=1 Tax=viral metagenome TaxID=1070528 RepID=A0A6M3K0N0_9ZZZZ
MNESTPFRITIELDEMKYRIIHLFMENHKKINDEIQKALDESINNFDFIKVVKNQIDSAIRQELYDYFHHGDGHQTIRDTMKKGLRNLAEEVTNNE